MTGEFQFSLDLRKHWWGFAWLLILASKNLVLVLLSSSALLLLPSPLLEKLRWLLGGPFCGCMRALLFVVCLGAPDVWKLPGHLSFQEALFVRALACSGARLKGVLLSKPSDTRAAVEDALSAGFFSYIPSTITIPSFLWATYDFYRELYGKSLPNDGPSFESQSYSTILN